MAIREEINYELQELLENINEAEKDYIKGEESEIVTCDFSMCYDRLKNLFELVDKLPEEKKAKETIKLPKNHFEMLFDIFTHLYVTDFRQLTKECEIEFDLMGRHYHFDKLEDFIIWANMPLKKEGESKCHD